jgi:hypothetical protein
MTRENTASPEWVDFAAQYGVGDVITATVTKPVPFGCLVEVGNGSPASYEESATCTLATVSRRGSSRLTKVTTASPSSGPDRKGGGCAPHHEAHPPLSAVADGTSCAATRRKPPFSGTRIEAALCRATQPAHNSTASSAIVDMLTPLDNTPVSKDKVVENLTVTCPGWRESPGELSSPRQGSAPGPTSFDTRAARKSGGTSVRAQQPRPCPIRTVLPRSSRDVRGGSTA